MNQKFCYIYGITHFLRGKWKIPLMFVIQGGPRCLRQLKTALYPITEQMPSKQLRDLKKYNLIEQKDYKTVPPCVGYLTDFGRVFTTIISQFQELDRQHKKKIVAVHAI